MSFLRTPWLIRLCQVGLGLLFVAAALPKIGDPVGFAKSIHNYRLLPVVLEHLMAMTLPWIELIVGLVLSLNVGHDMPRPFARASELTRAGAGLAVLLMVVFTLAVAQAVARDLDIACGCFQTSDGTRVGALKLVENLGLTAAAVVATLRPRR